jgi:ribosomal biogenesis protein LAS1
MKTVHPVFSCFDLMARSKETQSTEDVNSEYLKYSTYKLPKLTPWHDWEEWEQVKEGLFGKSREKQNHAINMIKVWTCRGNVPISVESTCAIIEILNDIYSNTPSKQEISQLSLAMALVRFVNGVVDQAQNSQYALSVSGLAQRLHLTQTLVDIRHTSTHSSLPRLEHLIEEANKALDWLRENYWHAQSIRHSVTENTIKQAFLKYRSKASSLLQRDKLREPEQTELIKGVLKQCQTVNVIQDTIIPLLLDPGALVPNRELLQSSTMSKWLESLYQTNQEKATYRSLELLELVEKQFTLIPPPEPLVLLWKPALDEFSAVWPHFFSTLIESITGSILQTKSVKTTLQAKPKKLAKTLIHFGADNSLVISEADVVNLILLCWLGFLLGSIRSQSTQRQKNKGKSKSKSPKATPKGPVSLSSAQSMIPPPLKALVKLALNHHTVWGRMLAKCFYNSLPHPARVSIETLQDFSNLNLHIEELTYSEVIMQSKFKLPALSSSYQGPSSLEAFEAIVVIQYIESVIPHMNPSTNPIRKGENVLVNEAWQISENWASCPIGSLPSGFPELTLPIHLNFPDQCKFG